MSGHILANKKAMKKIIRTLMPACMLSASLLLSASCNGQNESGNREQSIIMVKGQETKIEGTLPAIGTIAPDFCGVKAGMSEVYLSSFKGKRVILNVFPSLDTPTCAVSVRFFNEAAANLDNTVVLCLSMDLPFAQERFCTTEGIENVIPLSLFRSEDFFTNYGLRIAEGPMRGLMARAVILIDENGKIQYTQLVKNLSDEPDYDSVLKLLK